MKKEWFASWFDSPYYHLLYKNRDEQEAQNFIAALLQKLEIEAGQKALDLACGKGRHARFLASKGLTVTGLDISENSIAYAQTTEKSGLEFYVHDMRLPFKTAHFDYVFSFFTSFGYFKTEKEHQDMLNYIAQNLKPKGTFVLDFFNAYLVQKNIVSKEEKTIEGIHFFIKRYIRHGKIFKKIEFTIPAQEGQAARTVWFREQVRLYTVDEIKTMIAAAGMQVEAVYGDFALAPFEKTSSPRSIFVAKKL